MKWLYNDSEHTTYSRWVGATAFLEMQLEHTPWYFFQVENQIGGREERRDIKGARAFSYHQTATTMKELAL